MEQRKSVVRTNARIGVAELTKSVGGLRLPSAPPARNEAAAVVREAAANRG